MWPEAPRLPHYHGNRWLSSTDRGKRWTGAERLRPQPPLQSGDPGGVCDPSPHFPCRGVTGGHLAVRAARNFPLLPGDKSAWAGVEEGPPPRRCLASSVSQRIRPLATLLQSATSPWQPRAVCQLSGPRRSPKTPGHRLFRRLSAAPHHHGNSGSSAVGSRGFQARQPGMAWCPREREWQTGGVGSEVRAERRVRKVQGSRGLFSLGTRSGGAGCGGRGCERARTQVSAVSSRPISPRRTEMGGACLGFGSGRRQGAVAASDDRSIPVRKSPSCGVEI